MRSRRRRLTSRLRDPANAGIRALALSLLLLGCGEQRVELFDGCVGCVDAGAIDLRLRDPERCGAEARHCEDDEYCVDGVCVCRLPLVLADGNCRDPGADGDYCGVDRLDCPELCVDGACGAACPAGRTNCDDGCVDLSTHALHCGECDRPCGANQICVGGLCAVFVPAPCAACPCEACGAAPCETYPLRPDDPICLTD